MRFIEDFNGSEIKVSLDAQKAIEQWVVIQHNYNKFSSPICETIIEVSHSESFFRVKTECFLSGKIFEFEAWKVREGDTGFFDSINGIYAES
jgi:hypothetical protein